MAYTEADIKSLCKGRTAEQQKVIRYFLGGGGCLGSKMMNDEEYDGMVRAVVEGTDWRQKALSKIGLDADQVKEIDPVHFEGFRSEKAFGKFGRDRKWRTSVYQLSWLFFSSTQVYVWQYTFNMAEDSKKERTEEYFYKDITNFSTVSDTTELEILDKVNCRGVRTYLRKTVTSSDFALIVPGDKFMCSMQQSEYTERVIQAMKAKLREKKNV